MRRIALLSAAVLGAGLLSVQAPGQSSAAPSTPTAKPPAATQVDAPVPDIDWAGCGRGLRCATVRVPLDYDDPDGATTRLSLLKAPAGDRDRRIGSLFVNPGGPGGTSTDFASYFGDVVDPQISERFDIIGIDPRGTSKPSMRCRTDEPEPQTHDGTPVRKGAARKIFTHDAWFRGACESNPSPITAHMTTADTARDMDLIRQALGEEQLSYYGLSYGTYLGATYASMFPDRIRAMIVDGVVDPVAWSTGAGDTGSRQPFSLRLGSGYGAYEALSTAFDRCDRVSKKRCAFSGGAEGKFKQLLQTLKQKKYQGISWRDLLDNTLGSLYATQYYPSVMKDLQRLYDRAVVNGRVTRADARYWKPTAVLTRINRARGVPDRVIESATEGGPYSWFGRQSISDAFLGVSCADTDNPTDPWAWWNEGLKAERSAPWFTMTWTFFSTTCAQWPAGFAEDRYAGPYDVETSAPVLITGNYHDPATPISGAKALAAQLPNSRLLRVNAWGHGALQVSRCVDDAWTGYLIDGTLPEEGTRCKADERLFPGRG